MFLEIVKIFFPFGVEKDENILQVFLKMVLFLRCVNGESGNCYETWLSKQKLELENVVLEIARWMLLGLGGGTRA